MESGHCRATQLAANFLFLNEKHKTLCMFRQKLRFSFGFAQKSDQIEKFKTKKTFLCVK